MVRIQYIDGFTVVCGALLSSFHFCSAATGLDNHALLDMCPHFYEAGPSGGLPGLTRLNGDGAYQKPVHLFKFLFPIDLLRLQHVQADASVFIEILLPGCAWMVTARLCVYVCQYVSVCLYVRLYVSLSVFPACRPGSFPRHCLPPAPLL